MKVLNIIKTIILENSRFDVLLDKYTTVKKNKEGKKVNPLLDITKLAEIIYADPTTKKPADFDNTDLSPDNLSKVQPGAYSNWLLKCFEKPQLDPDTTQMTEPGTASYKKAVMDARNLFMEDLFKVTDDLKKFTKYKQYFPVDKRDINKFSSPDELFRFLNAFQLPEKKQKELDKKELKKEIRKTREGFNHPGATLEIETPTWTVVKISDVGPKGQEAASWYGGYYDYNNGESRWCTSPPDSSYFKNYAKDGPLYVILANDDKGLVGKRTGLPQERFQFHFPSNQFMDRLDHRIELIEFLNGAGSELKEYFKPEFAKGLTTAGGKKVEIEYPSSSAAKFIALYGFNEFFASLPDDITNLLFNNKSTEKIALDVPPTIGRFKQLEALLLMNCVKSLPNEIGELKNLSFLALPNNPSLHEIPDSVMRIPNLAFINLNGTKIKTTPAFINVFGEEGTGGSGFFSKKR
jgi:hypothetical protein